MARSMTARLRSVVVPDPRRRPGFAISVVTLAGLVVGLMLGLMAMAPPAQAHDDDETHEGYLLVQQALGHLAHDTTHEGIELAMEKVDDALAAPDHDGVAIAEVGRARTALEAGDVEQARGLLQDSIKAALSELPPAVGNETGTTLIIPELPGRGSLTGEDWLFLACSLLVLAAGGVLAYRFRPRDSVASLRRQLSGPTTTGGQGPTVPLTSDGSR